MAHVRSLFFDGPLSEVENKALTAYTLGRPSDVIWNITNRCNLLCDHCYMAADAHALPDQLSDEETIELITQYLIGRARGCAETTVDALIYDVLDRANVAVAAELRRYVDLHLISLDRVGPG